MATAAARDSWKPRARHLERAVLPEHLARLALLLLRVVCSDRAAVAVVVAPVALAVLAVQEVEALAAAVAVLAAAHTQQVLAGLVVLAGLWYWSFDHAAICSC
jgi:hypothetical protein